MYKNYIFDLYGTLVNIETNEAKDELWEKMSLLYRSQGAQYDPDDLKKKYEKYVEKLIESAGDPEIEDIDVEDVFFQLFKKKKIQPKKKIAREVAWIFRLLSLEKLELYPYALQVLEELKAKGKKLYLLSNSQTCFTRNELVALGLDKIFDGIYLSSDIGVKKPNSKAFEAVVKENDLNMKKTIMIGCDPVNDVEGAANFGLDSLLIKQESDEASPVSGAKFTIENGDLREILTLTLID